MVDRGRKPRLGEFEIYRGSGPVINRLHHASPYLRLGGRVERA